MPNPLAPRRPPTVRTSGVYLGTVTRAGDELRVAVPHLAPGYDWPARHAADVAPEVGQAVAVTFINDTDEELLILLRLD